MTRRFVMVAIVLAGLTVAAGAQKPDPDAQKVADDYIAVFNKGDAKGVAALYTPDATRLGPDGQLLKGRAAVEKAYVDGFAGTLKGAKLTIDVMSTQVVTPDVKVIEGRFATGTLKGRFVNTMVRRGNAWLLATVVTVPDMPGAK